MPLATRHPQFEMPPQPVMPCRRIILPAQSPCPCSRDCESGHHFRTLRLGENARHFFLNHGLPRRAWISSRESCFFRLAMTASVRRKSGSVNSAFIRLHPQFRRDRPSSPAARFDATTRLRFTSTRQGQICGWRGLVWGEMLQYRKR